MLDKLCVNILSNKENEYLKSEFEEIIIAIQKEIIKKL